MTTKPQAEQMIWTRMAQTKDGIVAHEMILGRSLNLPLYPRGAARLYFVMSKRVRYKEWRTDPIEAHAGILDLNSMADAAQIAREKAKQYYYSFVKENLMKLEEGKSKKGFPLYSLNPSRLLDFPEVPKTTVKSQAERMKAYRKKKRDEVEALRAKVAALETNR